MVRPITPKAKKKNSAKKCMSSSSFVLCAAGGADYDLTTEAHPDEVERLLSGWADAVWDQGRRFGTIGCLKDGRRFEITTHRAEAYDPESRKPEVAFGDSVEVDLSRRDFTVHALALRFPDLPLIDPPGGFVDLAPGRLRTPPHPLVSVPHHPPRVLPAARFLPRSRTPPADHRAGHVSARAPGGGERRGRPKATGEHHVGCTAQTRPPRPARGETGPAGPRMTSPLGPARLAIAAAAVAAGVFRPGESQLVAQHGGLAGFRMGVDRIMSAVDV